MKLEALSQKLISAVGNGVSAVRAIARSRPGEKGGRFVELDGRRWASVPDALARVPHARAGSEVEPW